MKSTGSLLAVAWALLPLGVRPETVKDREGAVRQDKAVMENDSRWIYNDWERGLAEGKRTGKPVLVVLRCVPCLACAGIDAQVLLQDSGLVPLLDQFICVRVINANALELTRFQFDYDLSFSTLLFNGDGTVYGRYGSWAHQKNPQNTTIASYQEALALALQIHKGYPANQASLAGKQGGSTPFFSPLEIPGLAGKYERTLNWKGQVVPSCVHCHQIGDAIRTALRDQNKPIPEEWIFPQPGPESIGLTLAPDRAAMVAAVAAGSIAERAGIIQGDLLSTVAGQTPISAADISWALHRAPAVGLVPVLVHRQGVEKRLQLELTTGWRQHADISRRVGTWGLRAMATGGLLLEDLSDAERAERKLANTGLALRVKHVGLYGNHAAAHQAGFQTEDLIVELDGLQARTSESEVIGRLLTTHKKGDSIPAVVVRGTNRKKLAWPIQ